MTARDSVITSLASKYTDLNASRDVSVGALSKILESGPARDAVEKVTEREVARIGERVSAHLKDMSSELDKRLSPTALAQVKVIKDLVSQNEELARRLKKLEGSKTP
jgi:hypothetical protein